MAKAKLKTVAKEVDEAAKLLQRLVRLKASDDNGYCSCVSCGRTGHYKGFDGGHYHSRSHSRLKLFEENIHPQCKRCNMLMGDPRIQDAYRNFLIETYGERRVRAMKKLTYLPPVKFNRDEVKEFQKELKARIKTEEWRIGEI